jgi:hypothetical protein
VLGRELRRAGKKPCARVVGMWLWIRRVKITEDGKEKNQRLRVDGCLERTGLVPL